MGSREELSEILANLDMETYLDLEGIDYKSTFGSRGPQLNVKTCPSCGGDSWKVFLNTESGLGCCFSGSCERKYNKYSFVQAHTGLSPKQTIEHIKAVIVQMGWRPPRRTVLAVEIEKAELKLPTSYAIPVRERNVAYLENRNITKEIAAYFHLRLCVKGWFKYRIEDQEKFMKFDNRIIIPIFDLEGVMVSYQGRDIIGTSLKKYLFPPGFAATGSHLYNAHNVHHTKRVVIGEGVFDVFSLKVAFDSRPELRDIVPIGTFGKHLSYGNENSQIAKFQTLKERGVEEVTFFWDGEPAAIRAAVDAAMMVKGLGLKVRVARLPDGMDPNEAGSEAVIDAYYSAVEINNSSATKLLLSLSKSK